MEKVYKRVNTRAQWKVSKTYEMGGKRLNTIKSMYVNNLASGAVKRVRASVLGLIMTVISCLLGCSPCIWIQ